MATYALRGLDPETIKAAKARARELGTSLDAVLRAYLEAYAAGESPAAQLGRAGGQARKASLTDEERRDIASRAGKARWSKR